MYRACLPLRSKLLTGAGGIQCPNYPTDKTRHHISDGKGGDRPPLPYSQASVGSSKPPLHTPGSHPAAATQDPQDLCSTPLSQPQEGSMSCFLPSLHLLRLMSSHSYNLPQLLGMAALPQLIFFSVSSTRTSLRTHLQSHF